jgi:hypothetical protein
MESRTIRPDGVGVLAAVAVAFAGTLGTFLLAQSSRISGWPVLTFVAVAASAAWYLQSQRTMPEAETSVDSIDISIWGVRHFRSHVVQSAISWPDLEEVLGVTTLGVTTLDGEGKETLHLVLNGSSGTSVALPHAVGVESGLREALERRFANCDTTTFHDAALLHGTQVFIRWRGERTAMHTPASLAWQVRSPSARA